MQKWGVRLKRLQAAVIAGLIGLAPLGASSAAAPDAADLRADRPTNSEMTEPVSLLPPLDIGARDQEREPVANPPSAPQATALGRGSASYYSAKFHGRRTASGEAFDNNAMTAAHRTLPFGSLVRVTNLTTGKTVVVRINDRGPFSRGRMIDVSRAAAEELGLIARGHAMVELALIAG